MRPEPTPLFSVAAFPPVVLAAVILVACAETPPPSTDAGAPPSAAAETAATDEAAGARDDVPRVAGLGFLDRDDVTVRMAGSGLIVDIVPMNAEVIGLATDDLRVYLEEALKKVPDTVPTDLQRDGTFFLIGFTSTQKEIPFEPSQVHLESEGRRFYPRYIVPVSAGFDNKVLRILEAPVWAVYIYEPGIDLVSTLEFSYRDEFSTGGAWRQIVQNVEEARGRAKR